jgi:outer membrane protein assembly factor BamD (BamD/ComL family)
MFQFTLSMIAQTDFSFYYNQGIENFKKENYNDAVTDFSNALKI